ncbi:serine/threonine-protein kinase [Actinomadura syzygii]|uniref:non-specific serine/threonine protein kinase n=1 Tax=Actinomadura syzygii TaxID=1427538 RepID=A0A5D0U836_9ACTN|nr:serine/threonine-protein kinase [Actinomadura syzygii]TYC13876.1 serine/threonine protein kinase [Actinomadura syzygii]
MPQTIAARYELVEVLGRGGMGAVWRARDRTLDREVAIKEVSLPPGLDEAQVARTYARTFREARSAARLDHPGIVTVHDVVEEDGRPWIVMQLVRADGLDKVIAREGPLPPGRVAAIGLDLLDALRAAHAAGVVHRDVKPGNVLLTAERAVLTDFGIATVAGDETLTQAGAIVGSPAYLAPEQARHQKATPASDLWSLGATLYAAVEGRPPYQRPDVWGVMAAVLSDDPDPVRLAGPLTPVLHGLLRKDPGERLSPDEAGRLLHQAAYQAAPGAVAAAFPPPVPPHNVTLPPSPTLPPAGPPVGPAPGPVRRPPWALLVPAGIFAVALVVAVVAVLVFTRNGDDRDRAGNTRSSPPVTASSTGTGTAAPAGYTLFRGSAFTAAVPQGWKTETEGDDATFTDQTQGVKRGIAIQRVAAFGDPGDGLSDAVGKMKSSGDYPDFKQESFDRNVPYKGQNAAEVQFAFTQNGIPARCRVRVFRFDGALYQAIMAADRDHWDQGVPYLETFLDTLQSTS